MSPDVVGMMPTMGYHWPTWGEWLADQDDETRRRALELVEKFQRAGCESPEDWVRSEVVEDFAQLARYLFLRRLWEDQLQRWRGTDAVNEFASARRLIEGGADAELVRELGASVAVDAVFRLLTLVDGVATDPITDDPAMPGWRLMEVDRANDELTGRDLGGLHESISEADPEGRDGEPLF